MKDKIKYLIYKLFISEDIDLNKSLIKVLAKLYPDFSKEDIIIIVSRIFEIPVHDLDLNLSLIKFDPLLININDYNELYLALLQFKKSLIYSDSFEP